MTIVCKRPETASDWLFGLAKAFLCWIGVIVCCALLLNVVMRRPRRDHKHWHC